MTLISAVTPPPSPCVSRHRREAPRGGTHTRVRAGCASQVNEKFTFKVPEGIPLDAAGPLLCAGITTYAPLARYVKRGDRVGIVGIGGLGHMALQYSRAMGADTWAISTSASKEAEARHFGANNFLLSTVRGLAPIERVSSLRCDARSAPAEQGGDARG